MSEVGMSKTTPLERLTGIIESRRAFMEKTVEEYISGYMRETGLPRDEAIASMIERMLKQPIR